MSNKINQNELNALIAKEIREAGLDNYLNLNKVKERVLQKLKDNKPEEINELENTTVAQINKFPDEDYAQSSTFNTDSNIPNTEPIQKQKLQQTVNNQPQEPKLKNKEEEQEIIPDFLKNQEHEKLIIFDFNELSEDGENLSYKTFRTFTNPDLRKSMSEMWDRDGKIVADVLQAKFEKVGELHYDYKNGTTRFIQPTKQPEIDKNGTYKGNPYKVEPNPVIEKNIENYITHNVDIDKKINDIITNIVKGYFLTNNERAINDIKDNSNNESEVNVSDMPLKENTEIQNEVFLNDLVKIDTDFIKTKTPNELLETINGKSNSAKLIYENDEVKKYQFNNKEYYIPKNAISLKNCYVLK